MLTKIHGVPHRPTGVDSRDILHVVDTPKIGIPGSGIHNCVADGPPMAFAPISESLELTIPEIPHHRVVWVRMSGIRGLFRILPSGDETIPCSSTNAGYRLRCYAFPHLEHSIPALSSPWQRLSRRHDSKYPTHAPAFALSTRFRHLVAYGIRDFQKLLTPLSRLPQSCA